MDPIKEAFSKVKSDIENLKSELSELKSLLSEIKRTQTQESDRQTDRHINPTHDQIQTDKPPLEDSSKPDLYVSTGNKGVQTDRQTDRQTDKSLQKFAQSINSDTFSDTFSSEQSPQLTPQHNKIDPISELEKVSNVLNSLDSIKKDLRQKIKRLTPKEMLVFSTIYQLENQQFTVDYSILSSKVGISQSSVRDHVKNLIKKGIPLSKEKHNNKRVTLHILDDFKKMASLQTILALREL